MAFIDSEYHSGTPAYVYHSLDSPIPLVMAPRRSFFSTNNSRMNILAYVSMKQQHESFSVLYT